MKASIAGVVASLPEIWRSRAIGTVGNASIKVIKMGGQGIPPEVHADFDELLLVLDGELPLVVEGEQLRLQTGEYCFVPRGASHSVPEGSFGVLLLVDVGQGYSTAP